MPANIRIGGEFGNDISGRRRVNSVWHLLGGGFGLPANSVLGRIGML